jgi:hypothetical protein
MAYLFNGTADALEFGSAPITGVPLTIALWFRPSSSAAAVICSIGVPGSTDRFQISAIPSTPVINATTVQGGTAQAAALNTAIALNTWHHGAAVFSAINSRQVFFNGTGSAVNTGSATPFGLNRINISGAYAPTLTAWFPGAIAEVAIWNAALTADEVTAHFKGYRPDLIRPRNLVFYPDLIRTLRDRRSGSFLSAIGSPTIDPHPRRIG